MHLTLSLKKMRFTSFFIFVLLICSIFNINGQTLQEKEHLRQLDDTFKLVKDQYFRILDGDTINKIDEVGLLQGEWERLYPNGDFKCKGRYKNGKKDGYWERKYPNGNWQYQANIKDGYSHGFSKYYYKNGNLKKEGNYKNGFPDGLIKTYNKDGSILSEENYQNVEDNGIKKAKIGIFVSDIDSILNSKEDSQSIKGVMVDGLVKKSAAQRSGLKKEDIILRINKNSISNSKALIQSTYSYHIDDTLEIELIREGEITNIQMRLIEEDFETVKALLHGESRYYDESGNLLREGKYNKGKRDDEWKFYSEEGKLTVIVFYKNDTVVETKSIR